VIGRIATALACLLLSELILSSPTTAVPLPPVLTSGSETVNVGDVFTIPISIADTDGLTSFQFDLAFNPVDHRRAKFHGCGHRSPRAREGIKTVRPCCRAHTGH